MVRKANIEEEIIVNKVMIHFSPENLLYISSYNRSKKAKVG